MSAVSSASFALCPACGASLPPGALTCVQCWQLVHLARIEELAAKAAACQNQGHLSAARETWREILPLLPGDSPEREVVHGNIKVLDRQLGAAGHEHQPGGSRKRWLKRLGPFAPIALILFKFKSILLLAITKGKFLLFGLTKAKTFFSMLAFLGVYWALYGWWFAVGIVLSIYLHEMGHYITIRQFGLAAESPLFIPGVGAFVRLQQVPLELPVRARISLAGPLYGLGAALLSYGIYLATGWNVCAAIAHAGVWINLFNLIPIWQLDGGQASLAFRKKERAAILVTAAALWFIFHETMFFLIAAGAVYRLFTKDEPESSHMPSVWSFVGLLIAFGVLGWLATQVATHRI